MRVHAKTLVKHEQDRLMTHGSCIVAELSASGSPLMSFADTTPADGTVEECLDEINDFMEGLRHYPPTVLAVAVRVHLEALLHALLEGNLCTREEVRDFVRELERDALQYEAD
jgi:hypothetical protein